MSRMSARLNLLEKQNYLLNSRNEGQDKDIHLVDGKINRMINNLQMLVDLKNSELETKIMGNKYYTKYIPNFKMKTKSKRIMKNVYRPYCCRLMLKL